jgi:hypothetical protein
LARISADPAISAFGDDSTIGHVVVCAFAVFPTARVPAAEAIVARHLERVGVPPGARIHCREMFHPAGRAATPWASITPQAIEALLEQLCTDLSPMGPRPFVVTLDLGAWPRELSLPNGQPWRVDDKSVATMAYQMGLGMLGHTFTATAIRVWIDPEKTKIPWGAGHRKAELVRRTFIDLGPSAEPYELVPDVEDDPKPALIDIADVYAYTTARVRTAKGGRQNRWFESLFRTIDPVEVTPPPPSMPLKWVKKE